MKIRMTRSWSTLEVGETYDLDKMTVRHIVQTGAGVCLDKDVAFAERPKDPPAPAPAVDAQSPDDAEPAKAQRAPRRKVAQQ